MSTYQVNQIADWFLASIDREAGDTISHFKLQKLMYYTQAWSLAINGKCLFDEDFEAWTHGPVLPSLWYRFKELGWDSIPPSAISSKCDISTEVVELLSYILNSYGNLSAKPLEELTHS
ncbi:MAG: type II toxin-antitoxin system antitoxin SocA domain-containing protein [Pseudomonadota bacterium]